MSRSKIAVLLVAAVIVGGLLVGGGVVAGGLLAPAISSAGPVAAINRLIGGYLPPAAASAPQAQAVTGATGVAQAATLPAAASPVKISISPSANTESQILEAVYQKVNPSVVQVVNLAQSSRVRGLGVVPQGEGSGFVWDMQGDIVTNDHVVDGADKLQVIFPDGTTLDATLVGTDPSSDIAVIRVDPKLATLVPVELGDMAQVHVGDMAIAIGNPFGFEGTMTRGIISALGRNIPSQTSFSIPEAIQTDAAINPGNSGGPLLNELGQVIGVNDQIESSSGSNSGVGFAIPISIVQRVAPALIQNGKYEHAYLGISGGTYTKAWASALGLPENTKGIYVMAVTSGGPAARAGLKAGAVSTDVLLGVTRTGAEYLQSGGDLITAINGRPLASMDDLLVYLEANSSPGQAVKLTVLRDGSQQTITVTLEARPAQTSAS